MLVEFTFAMGGPPSIVSQEIASATQLSSAKLGTDGCFTCAGPANSNGERSDTGNGWHIDFLVGGFNPSEKYESKWESSPNRGENNKYLKPPPSFACNLPPN